LSLGGLWLSWQIVLIDGVFKMTNENLVKEWIENSINGRYFEGNNANNSLFTHCYALFSYKFGFPIAVMNSKTSTLYVLDSKLSLSRTTSKHIGLVEKTAKDYAFAKVVTVSMDELKQTKKNIARYS
jgi:hypothetical protein